MPHDAADESGTGEIEGSDVAVSGVWSSGVRAAEGDDVATFAIHDAKNVACALRANVAWLRSICADELRRADVLEVLDEIGEACVRLVGLTRDALSAQRRRSRLSIVPSPVHLATLIGCAVDRVRRRADASGLHVEVRGPADLSLELDRALFSRVLDNLLDNAVRVSRPGDVIAVTYRRRGRRVELRVSDQGPGVPPALRERIFELFWRGPESRPGGAAETAGVGLAFCRAVAEAHRGTLVVEDAEEGGAAFVLRLPVSERAPVARSLQHRPSDVSCRPAGAETRSPENADHE